MLYHALRSVKCDHFQVYPGFTTRSAIQLGRINVNHLTVILIDNTVKRIHHCFQIVVYVSSRNLPGLFPL